MSTYYQRNKERLLELLLLIQYLNRWLIYETILLFFLFLIF